MTQGVEEKGVAEMRSAGMNVTAFFADNSSLPGLLYPVPPCTLYR